MMSPADRTRAQDTNASGVPLSLAEERAARVRDLRYDPILDSRDDDCGRDRLGDDSLRCRMRRALSCSTSRAARTGP